MDERSSRMFVGVCLLVLLWIGTYWVYDPGTDADDAPDISFADPDAGLDTGPAAMSGAGVQNPPALAVTDRPPDAGTTVIAGPSRPSESTPVQGSRVVPPRFRDYTVRENETLRTIARDQLGSEGFWSVIAQANPLKDPRRLRAGEVIHIPVDPTNIQGRVVAGGGDAPPQPTATPPVVVEYIVQPGDSLTKIARAYYGSVRHADFIYESNKDVMPDKDSLRVGQTLRLLPLGDE